MMDFVSNKVIDSTSATLLETNSTVGISSPSFVSDVKLI